MSRRLSREQGMAEAAAAYPPVFAGEIKDERIVMGHGAGGRKMHRLIRNVFVRFFSNPALNRLADGALIQTGTGRMCMTTDSYVVQPLFFPGGDIGRLAVAGTVNDLSVMGAEPKVLSLSLVIREGLAMATLERICRSIASTAREAGVDIVTGDTKVIEGSGAEELYINTTGIGWVSNRVLLGPEQVQPGDVLLLNGPIGEHESSIAVARGNYHLRGKVLSDCAPLNRLISSIVKAGGVRFMRDPTRGGLATTLNEFSEATGLGFVVHEEALGISRQVRAVAGMLGLDPLYMANEGKVLVVADGQASVRLLHRMRRYSTGRLARVVGEVVRKPKGVWLKTGLGAMRPVMMLEGEQLPRIC